MQDAQLEGGYKNKQMKNKSLKKKVDLVFNLLIAEIEELEKNVEELELKISMNENTFQQMNEY